MNKQVLLIIGLTILVVQQKSIPFWFKSRVEFSKQVKTISIPQVPSIKQDTKPFAGYQLGAFYKTKTHKRFSASAEANFSVLGSSIR
jgi:hypothetical protein